MRTAADVTELLVLWSNGDAAALDRLMPLVYAECRRIAARQMRREREDHTLSPTALVNELYLRLVDQQRTTWKDRAHFFGIAGHLMRRILVDHARARLTAKRGGHMTVSLDGAGELPDSNGASDVLALDEALGRLGAHDPEQQRVVELRFFAGLTVEETAEVLGRSPRTIKREWQHAKAWLHRELRSG
ncbi:MAG TPA: sigma-70 family RNA polymerase sigma factor [Gemmatimonadaceae bacterium]|jgi:RNA polymerase sigma factor (TIGR02999 family)|nr:sigma-70 family RNA polymerase sigma factor [Gemmatimonadaceae bacterium]